MKAKIILIITTLLLVTLVNLYSQRSAFANYNCKIGANNVQYGEPVEFVIDLTDSSIPFDFPNQGKLIMTNTQFQSNEEILDINLPLGEKIELTKNFKQPGTYNVSLQDNEGMVLCQMDSALLVDGEAPQSLPTAQPTPDESNISVEIDHPGSEITGETASVSIRFNNLNSTYNYLACLRYDANIGFVCSHRVTYYEVDKAEENNRLVILRKVCGDGTNAVKGSDFKSEGKPLEECNANEDYFHEGNIYRIGLAADTPNPVVSAVAEFYVNYYYPSVLLNNGQIEVVAQKGEDKPKELIIRHNGKSIKPNEFPDGIEIENNGNPGGPIQVIINAIRKAGGDKRNDYQIQLDPVNAPFSKITECVDLKHTDPDKPKWQTTDPVNFGAGEPLSTLPEGKYIIRVNERVNRDTKFWFDSPCDTGFSYYAIPIEIKRGDDGVNRTYVLVGAIEFDPENRESNKLHEEKQLGALPCAKWVTVDENGKEVDADRNDDGVYDPNEILTATRCAQFQTGFLPLSTSPLGFIQDLGTWLLTIASAAAFIFIIYSGYILMTSQGDKEKIANAREIMTSAITGLIFIILSIAILEIIGVDILQIPGFER